MIKTFAVSGTGYEMGFKVGKVFKPYVLSHIDKYEEEMKNPEAQKFVQNMKIKLQQEHPETLDEIRGRADAAGIRLDTAILLFSPEYFYGKDGCTTAYMRDRNGKVLFSHNEDNTYFNMDSVALVKYCYKDKWVVSCTHALKLAGCSYSYNSDGVIITCNFITSDDRNLDELSRYIIIRDVITSSSLEEAVERIKNVPSASPFSLNICDTNTQRVVNVEKDIDTCYIYEMTDRYARANHFILKPGDVVKKENSIFRQDKITEEVNALSTETVCLQDLIDALSYSEEDYVRCIFKDYKLYGDKDVSSTVANLSYDGNTGMITFRDYVGDDTANWKYGEFVPNLIV